MMGMRERRGIRGIQTGDRGEQRNGGEGIEEERGLHRAMIVVIHITCVVCGLSFQLSGI